MHIYKNTNLLNEIDISWCIVQMLFLAMWPDPMKVVKRYKSGEILHGYNRLQNNGKLYIEKALSMSKGKRCRISFIFDMTFVMQWK